MTPPKRTRRYFSASLKRGVVVAFKGGESTEAIAERLGIPVGNIRNWVKDTRMVPRRAPRGLAEKLRKAACVNDASEVYVQAAKAMDATSAKQAGILSLVQAVVTSSSFNVQVKLDMIKALLQ